METCVIKSTMCKYSFLKQWFTVSYDDKSVDLIYSMTNNHYVHGWLEERGYYNFENIITKDDLDIFLTALNESSNTVYSFDDYFSKVYIDNYTLWDIDKSDYWSSVEDYQKHVKLQMCYIFDELWDVNKTIESGISCILKYHVYYGH